MNRTSITVKTLQACFHQFKTCPSIIILHETQIDDINHDIGNSKAYYYQHITRCTSSLKFENLNSHILYVNFKSTQFHFHRPIMSNLNGYLNFFLRKKLHYIVYLNKEKKIKSIHLKIFDKIDPKKKYIICNQNSFLLLKKKKIKSIHLKISHNIDPCLH